MVAVAGCVDSEESGTVNGDDDDGQNGGDSSDGGNGDTPAVTVHEHSLERGQFGDATIVGEAENTSGEMQDYIELTARFYDTAGTRIGETILWNITDVAADNRFTFELTSTVDYAEVNDYELEWSTSAL